MKAKKICLTALSAISGVLFAIFVIGLLGLFFLYPVYYLIKDLIENPPTILDIVGRPLFAIAGLLVILTILCLLNFLILEPIRLLIWKCRYPKTGYCHNLHKLLKTGDIVYINGKSLEFDHIARAGEQINVLSPPSYSNTIPSDNSYLAFRATGLNYCYYPISILSEANIIYNSRGLKWYRTDSDKALYNHHQITTQVPRL